MWAQILPREYRKFWHVTYGRCVPPKQVRCSGPPRGWAIMLDVVGSCLGRPNPRFRAPEYAFLVLKQVSFYFSSGSLFPSIASIKTMGRPLRTLFPSPSEQTWIPHPNPLQTSSYPFLLLGALGYWQEFNQQLQQPWVLRILDATRGYFDAFRRLLTWRRVCGTFLESQFQVSSGSSAEIDLKLEFWGEFGFSNGFLGVFLIRFLLLLDFRIWNCFTTLPHWFRSFSRKNFQIWRWVTSWIWVVELQMPMLRFLMEFLDFWI